MVTTGPDGPRQPASTYSIEDLVDPEIFNIDGPTSQYEGDTFSGEFPVEGQTPSAERIAYEAAGRLHDAGLIDKADVEAFAQKTLRGSRPPSDSGH